MENTLIKVAASVTWCSFRLNMCFLCMIYKQKVTAWLVSETWAQSPFLARFLGYYWASYFRPDPQSGSKLRLNFWGGIEIPESVIYVPYLVPQENWVPLHMNGFSNTHCTEAIGVPNWGYRKHWEMGWLWEIVTWWTLCIYL